MLFSRHFLFFSLPASPVLLVSLDDHENYPLFDTFKNDQTGQTIG